MPIWGVGISGGEATAGGNGTRTLAFASQLPQDFYINNTPPPAPVPPPAPAPPVPAPPVIVSPPATSAPPITNNQNLGGTHYGPVPPTSPQYGWFWSKAPGQLFIYEEPGLWVQVGTS